MTEKHYYFYRNKINSIIARMSEHVRSWTIGYISIFGVLITLSSILLAFNPKNITFKIVGCVILWLVGIGLLIAAFYMANKYYVLERQFRMLEDKVTHSDKFKIKENYDSNAFAEKAKKYLKKSFVYRFGIACLSLSIVFEIAVTFLLFVK